MTALNVFLRLSFIRLFIILGFLLTSQLNANPASAHISGENYVWINVEESGLSGRVEITGDVLAETFGIDLPEDPEARLEALQSSAGEIKAYIIENFTLSADGAPITLILDDPIAAAGAEGRFVAFPFVSEPFDVPEEIDITNRLMVSWDKPLYRSLAVIEYDRIRNIEYPADYAVLSFGPASPESTLNLVSPEPVLSSAQFVWQGIIHILLGPDHVLFLIALLLTAVLVWQPPKGWARVDRAAPAFWHAALIVTLFAIAHSITLTMTVLGLVQPNIQFVETLIALSIAVVALNNLYPVFNAGRWLLIVFFGLFHGMGFASAMSDLQFRLVEPVKILFNFNVGIEIGQIVILLIVLPLFFVMRNTAFFKNVVFRWGNILIAAIAIYWTVTRALGV